jgi:hypothetical protein
MPRGSTVFQVRTDDALKAAFAEATLRERTTPSDALRHLMQQYVRDSLRREAAKQSRIVAAASGEAGDLALIADVQDIDGH